jgi:hypothetical protein
MFCIKKKEEEMMMIYRSWQVTLDSFAMVNTLQKINCNTKMKYKPPKQHFGTTISSTPGV